MDIYSKKNDEKMDTLLQKVTDSVGTQLQGMSSTIVKVKEEEDDRYKQISERIMNMKRILDIDENTKTEVTNPGEHKETRIKVRLRRSYNF